MNTETLVNDYHCAITADITAAAAFENICRVSAWCQ